MQSFMFKVLTLLGDKLISLVKAYFPDFSRRRPPLASDRFVVHSPGANVVILSSVGILRCKQSTHLNVLRESCRTKKIWWHSEN